MFHVIVEGLKFNLRQRKWVIFNALFPIFLMVLLGVMLSDTNSINSENEVINICYYNESGKDAKRRPLDLAGWALQAEARGTARAQRCERTWQETGSSASTAFA